MKYRKKPVVIEAIQWFQMGDHPAVVMKSAPSRYADEGIPWINTLEGGHVVTPGDWIITGVHGENYPCKPDIFEKTYELAEIEGIGKAFDDDAEGLREKLGWSEIEGEK